MCISMSSFRLMSCQRRRKDYFVIYSFDSLSSSTHLRHAIEQLPGLLQLLLDQHVGMQIMILLHLVQCLHDLYDQSARLLWLGNVQFL